MTATATIDLHPPRPEENDRIFARHAPQALAALAGWLAAEGAAPVLLLAGPAGCGRAGLLEAAARRAARSGGEIRVLPLDLDGYEEGSDLSRFLEVQAAKRWELDDEARENLREEVLPLLPRIPLSSAGAALVALLLRLDDPGVAGRHLLPVLPGNGAGPTGDARPVLAALIDRVSLGGLLILHVAASDLLNDPLRRWLLDAQGKHPRLRLALSCAAADVDERVAPRTERLRLDLEPLPAGGLLEPLQQHLHDIDLETSDRLQRFLDLAALCGPNVPAELLFHHLELDEDEREEILDEIDDDLVENAALRLFVDHQYGHPSFPGLLTYAFLSPRLNHALLEPVPQGKREQLAAELLEFLNRSVPLHTRGMTLLRLTLAAYHKEDAARRFFQRELRVWIGDGETADLTAELAATGIDARDLVGTAQQASGRWPPHYRLAFLDAAGARLADLSRVERVELHNLRAEALREIGRLPEGVAEARTSLDEAREVHGPRHPATVRAWNLLGILLRENGNPTEAKAAMEQALALHDAGEKDENLGSMLANLGTVQRDLGDREGALASFERALDVHRQAAGDVHPMVANDLANLASLERELERPQKALEYLRPIVDIVRRMYGDAHPETGRALTNVAALLRELGETNAARLHVDAALQVDRQAFGEDHPQVIADLNNLAVLERELGETGAAREHFQLALSLAEGTFGLDDPMTVQLRQALAAG
jgi:tetratricopeptide (TPR) repeat protein